MTYTGELELVARKQEKRTFLASTYYEGALKMTRPVYLDATFPCVYLIHIGGGYVDGDTYETRLCLEEESELAVTTQSFTKVYKTPKKPVVQNTTIHLKSNSILHYMPDPLIAYESARFSQETTIHLEDGASFFYKDIITPGWAEDGSVFRYEWIRSKLNVFKNRKRILMDHLFLSPDEAFHSVLQMEGYTHVGTLIFYHEAADRGFKEDLFECLEHGNKDVRWGLSLLPGDKGVILRVLSHRTSLIEQIAHEAYQWASLRVFQKPIVNWRKY